MNDSRLHASLCRGGDRPRRRSGVRTEHRHRSPLGSPVQLLQPRWEEDCAAAGGCQRFQIYPFSTFVDIELESYSLAAAWKRGPLSLGLGIRYSDFAEETRARRIDLDREGQPEFLIEQVNGSRIFGSDHDSDLTFVAGAKWDISEAWSTGAVSASIVSARRGR